LLSLNLPPVFLQQREEGRKGKGDSTPREREEERKWGKEDNFFVNFVFFLLTTTKI